MGSVLPNHSLPNHSLPKILVSKTLALVCVAGSPLACAGSPAVSELADSGSEGAASPADAGLEASGNDASLPVDSGPDARADAVSDAAANPGRDGEGGAGNADGEAGAPSGCNGAAFCDDFETNDTPGMAPDVARWSVNTGCGMNDPNSTVTIDGTTPAASGTHSVKLVGGGNTCGPIFTNTTAFAGLGDTVFVRFFARFTVGMPAEHSAFVLLGLTPDAGVALNPSNGLQLTGQSNVLVWNWHDTTLPNIDTQGTSQSVDAPLSPHWTCIELETNAATGAIAAWVDSTPIAGLTYDPGTTAMQPGVNSTWASGYPASPRPTSLSLGWVSYGDTMNTVWFDDVVVSGGRIGCTP
jgi:hypothetical protein